MYRKICKICGREFYTSSSSKKYCDGEHTSICIVCGKEFIIPNYRLYERNKITCSKECAGIHRSISMKLTLQNLPKDWNKPKSIYHHICKLCGKTFDSVYKRSKYCDRDHYTKCVVCGKSFKLNNKLLPQIPRTCSEGCSKILANNTCKEKYGVCNYSETEEWKQYQRENKQKINEKRKSTNLDKFGKEYYSSTDKWLVNHMSDCSKIDNLMKFTNDPRKFIEETFKEKPTIQMLSTELGINSSSTGDRIHKYKLEDLIEFDYSSMEQEISEFLIGLDEDIVIKRNDRIEIKPYELDLYLPDYNIGIECNPTSTHNSSANTWNNEEPPTLPSYHKMKTDLCEENGIFLFHIFGYEWTYKQDIIESMIKNIVKKTDNRIYARKCSIKEVPSHDAYLFLQENHRQGGAGSSIRYGLYYQDKLVSLMTFSKMRSHIGTGHDDTSDCYELVRFCNLLNTSVVGGASKLFKKFIDDYNPKEIRSFSDRAHTSGNLYKILGFEELRRSSAGYVWVDSRTDIAYNRVNAMKSNLRKFLKDDSIDLSKSEKTIMEEHGYLAVYDSGTITWQWLNR